MSAAPAYPLRAERGGLAPIDLPRPRMTPAEIPLTLSADVLRLPYTPATRMVLAEIVSLHAATGCCDASNPHFMARLSIKHDAVNDAIKRLDEDGLIVKVVDKAAGFYRTLTPLPAAIAAKATTNPYPEKSTSYSENPTRYPNRKNRLGYSENPTSPNRENRLPLVGKADTNTPYNIPSNIPVNPTPSADASAVVPEKKIEEVSASLPADEVEIVPPVARPPRAKAAKPPKAGEPEHFADFWAAWPKKESRADAVKAFAKLSPADQAAAASRADTWLTARPDLAEPARYRYIPHATTWLNNARWTDDNPLPLTTTTHATATQISPNVRPVNGHKPSGAGGSLARSLAERPR
jgi:hypothetical protein